MESNLVQNLVNLKSLPETWAVKDFKEVVSDNSGGNKKLAKSNFLNEGEIAVIDQGKKLIAGYYSDTSLAVKTQPPYVVFGDHTRAFKYVDFPFIMGADGTKVLQPKKENCDTKYLYYFFLSINVPNTGYNRHFKYLKKLKIPLPPLDQQKKIASILDAADAYRQKTKALIEKYDELTQSLFLEMFGDTWTNPMGWDFYLVEDLAAKEKHSIKAGPFGSSLKKEYYVESGYKIYGQEQVIKDDLSFGDYYIDESKFLSLKNCKVKEGDILISLVGTYGKIAIVPENYEQGIINPRLMKITPNQEIIRPDFLKTLLRSSGVLLQTKNKSRGGTMDIVNVGIMRKIKVPLPPLELQNQFAKRVQAIKAQKAQAQASLAQAEDLFNSLLQRAFKGELV